MDVFPPLRGGSGGALAQGLLGRAGDHIVVVERGGVEQAHLGADLADRRQRCCSSTVVACSSTIW
jgi:hypothetical protein